MKNNNDFDFISSKFNEENINAPDSLELDSILQNDKVDNKKIVKLKPKRWLGKTVVSLVACFAVIFTTLTATNSYVEKRFNNGGDGLISFNNYAEVNALLTKLNEDEFSFGRQKYKGYVVEEYAMDSANSQSTTENATLFSKTNKQVEAVDESDVVKTDGKNIYYINDTGVDIYSADGENSKLISTIDAFYADYDEMYLYGDKLIVISDCDYQSFGKKDLACSTVYIYDISNPEKPNLENKFSQRGVYTSSRMIDNYLYLVSDYSAMPKDIPFTIDYHDNVEKISCDDMYCYPNTNDSSFVVISALDVLNGDTNKKTKAILGCNRDIYCNEKNMYLTNTVYDWKYYSMADSSRIVKIQLDGLDFNFVASATVNGFIDDQYSLDEHNGYLRVSTTLSTSNFLYVLDENLKQVGAVKNFAQGETIKAVRYVDDFAYVITFEQTDPLFVIDLTDPTKPEITGSVEITGFSDNLIPVDKNTILGVGYGELQGVKLALFDVSDKNKPTVLDSKEYECTSNAQYNIKALLINNDAGYYAFAYDTPFYYTDELEQSGENAILGGIITFEINKNKLVETNDFKSEKAIHLNRCVYIGDYIYALNTDKEIQSYDMSK